MYRDLLYIIWVVVSNIFYVHPYLRKIPILTNIFQRGWSHQLGNIWYIVRKDSNLPIIPNFRIAIGGQPKKTHPEGPKRLPKSRKVKRSVPAGFWEAGKKTHHSYDISLLGGGFKHFLFPPLPGEMIQID